ncbi:MAG: hypothetical protein AAFW84_26615 [Cyanobacteria bacterium J06635_15]
MLNNRLSELGIDRNDLVLRYCKLLKSRGVDAKPVNKRNMLYRVLEGETVPKVDTFQDIIAALDGEIRIVWKQEQEVSL